MNKSLATLATQRVTTLLMALALLVYPSSAQAEEVDYSSMSKAQLETELDSKGLGGPITLTSIGGTLAIGGAVFLVAGIQRENNCSTINDAVAGYSSVGCSGGGLIAVGVGGLVVGGTLATIGGVWWGSRGRKRKEINNALSKTSQMDWRMGVANVGAGQGLKFEMRF